MGFLDKLKEMTKPYDEDEDFLDELEPEPEPEPDFSAARPERRSTSYEPPRQQSRSAGRSASVRSDNVVNLRSNAADRGKVVLMQPERYAQATEIADHLREKRTVVVNLERASKEVARRLLDFLSGAAYVQEGKISKASAYTYVLTPAGVEIVGDLLDELESSSLYL